MLRWFRTLLILELIAIFVVASLIVGDPENQTDVEARHDAPGRLIQLSQGVTHFEYAPPATPDQPVVVLVPGLATPYFVWDHTFRDLRNAGFGVLRYDLYGRGYSDRPAGVAHDVEFFDRQLGDLIAALKLSSRGPVHIVGLSMGGVISIHFADRHPELVRSLSLIAPAGFPLEIPAIAKFVRLPLIGDYFIHAFGHGIFMRRLHRNLYNQSLFAEYKAAFEPQMYIRGTKAALLSSLRNMPLGTSRPVYERVVQERGVPLQLIWGPEDLIVPYSVGQAMRDALPAARWHAIPDGGHIVHWEKPNAVFPKLLSFLKDH